MALPPGRTRDWKVGGADGCAGGSGLGEGIVNTVVTAITAVAVATVTVVLSPFSSHHPPAAVACSPSPPLSYS